MATKLPTLDYGRCELFYKTGLSEDNWIRLVTPTTDRKFNLKKISFDAGVTLCQASAGVIESCSVHVNPVEDSISIEWRDDEEGRNRVFKVEFECLSIAAPELETKAAKRELGIANAKTLPLANVCGSFKAIRLEKLDIGDLKGTLRVPADQALLPKHERVIQQIRILLVSPAIGKASHDPQAYIREAFAMSLAETQAQKDELQMMHGCRIKTSKHPKAQTLILEAWPKRLPENETSLSNNKVAQRYKVLFIPRCDAILPHHASPPIHPI